MVDTDQRRDVKAELQGAEAKAEAGWLGGRAVSNYYTERPWIALIVALFGAVSIIIGAAFSGWLGLIGGSIIAVIVALLPTTRTQHRDESTW